jgi:hypothetical protein
MQNRSFAQSDGQLADVVHEIMPRKAHDDDDSQYLIYSTDKSSA